MYPIETMINKQYLVYLMLSDNFLRQVKLVTENRVKIPKINQEELSRLIVCCPNNKEQEAIADYLDEKCAQIKAPFHVYSMRQAIEEGYILDVLANYTTVKEAFKLIRVSEDNPELIEGQAYIEGCNNKTKVLKRTCYGMRNFNNFRKRILFCHTAHSATQSN